MQQQTKVRNVCTIKLSIDDDAVRFHSALLEKTLQLYEGNNDLNFLFHDQRFCQARSSENMARQVYLRGRPLVRCTFFGSFPAKTL